MTTAIIDTMAGNLHSAAKAFERMAAETGAGPIHVTSDPDTVAAAERIVLPGDGAFPACAAALAASGLGAALQEAVHHRGRPFLGICVGMQLLATRGHEYRETAGLDWIAGDVVAIPTGAGRKVPHMGWNDLRLTRTHPLTEGLGTGDHAYFVHSYHLRLAAAADLLADCDYGVPVTAIVARDNVAGTQFHPEKSQRAGLRLIANFLRWRP